MTKGYDVDNLDLGDAAAISITSADKASIPLPWNRHLRRLCWSQLSLLLLSTFLRLNTKKEIRWNGLSKCTPFKVDDIEHSYEVVSKVLIVNSNSIYKCQSA